MTMSGEHWIINSLTKLKNCVEDLYKAFREHKYLYVKIEGGRRTLPQNALKSVWYKDIADHRGDVTAKDVELECKLNYGIPILRRDPGNNWIYERSIDLLTYEKKVKAMSRFAVTSIMSVDEKKEYLNMMQNDYPFLTNERALKGLR